MASRAYPPLSVRPLAPVALDNEHLQKSTPSTSSSSPGSLPIRAPLTLDDSEYESNGEFDLSSNGTVSDSEIQSEGFLSGEDSETASVRPTVVNQVEEPVSNDVCEEKEEEEEKSVNIDEIYEPGLLVEDTILRIMPFAQLSGYDDDDDDDDDDEEEEEQEVVTVFDGSEVLSVVRVSSVDMSENFISAPRVKVFDAEEEKFEPLVLRGSLAVNQSLLKDELVLVNDTGLGNLVEAKNGVMLVQAGEELDVKDYGLDTFLEDKVGHGECSISLGTNVLPQCVQNNFNIEQFERVASSELEEKGLNIDSINGLEVDSKEITEMLEGTSILVGDTSIVNSNLSELMEDGIKLDGINGLEADTRETTEMVKGASIMAVGTSTLKSASSELDEEGIKLDGINGLEVGTKEEKGLNIDSIDGLEVDSKEITEMLEGTSILVGDTSIVNSNLSELMEDGIKLDGINGLEADTRETTEMVKGASIMVVGTSMLKSASSELDEEGIKLDGINGLEVGTKETTAMVEGTSIMAGDTSILKFDIEDYSNSRMAEQNTSDNHLEKHNPTIHTNFNRTVQPVLGAVGENIEYAGGEPAFFHPIKRIAVNILDQESEHEKLISINESAISSKLHSCSALFESCDDACECNKIQSVESSKSSDSRLLKETTCMENGLSGTVLGISQEAEPYSECQSHEHVETNLDLGDMVQKEDAVDSNTIGKESRQDGLTSEGNAEGLISVDLEQFMEQVSAFSTFLGSNGSGKNSQQEQAVRSSNEKINSQRDDAKKQFVYAASTDESIGSRVTITSADESGIISLKGPAGCSSLHHFDAQAGLENNISEKEKEKIEKIQGMSVKFLRFVQRINLSSEDYFVSKVLGRLVGDIGKHSNQEFVIKSAKILAKKLEDDDKDDLNFSLNILVLGKSGVGKSATINSIFGERKVATNAFEPATTSAKEIAGTIDGIKIRILDTPGLRSSLKEQAFNRKILLSIKKHMRKLSPDVILYVDRIDAQTRDFSDLPLLRSITSSLGPSMWQRTILTLTHAASTPLDGPSGSPLSYEVFVAEKSRLVQQSISQAVGDMCQVNPSFTCPVSLVENHLLNGKNINGECVLPNGLRWRSQLLLLSFSLKVLSGFSSMAGPQNLLDHWKQLFFQNNSPPPLNHMLSSLMQSNAHLKSSANWN